MAFSEFEHARCKRLVEAFLDRRRPPPHIPEQLDLGYRVSRQSIEIFEIRPRFREPETKREIPVAKTTFIRGRSVWRIFWQRRDLKWHGYASDPEVMTIEAFLQVVGEDRHGCFWG